MSETKYMRKKGESAIYIATEWLEKRDDMEFCDLIVNFDGLICPEKALIAPEIKEVNAPIVNVNVPDTIYEASLAQKNLATSEGINDKKIDNTFVCTVKSCGKSFQSLRALHMHGLGAHRVGRVVNV
ncbi:MAG: hypothetical protein NUV76_12215 [Candidatus Kuenenia sp.]|nr:hypothetical protein [Candidatus Kuenenia sp.]